MNVPSEWPRALRPAPFLAIVALVLAACGTADLSPSESEPEPSGSAAAPTDAGPGEPASGGTLVFAGARLAASLDPALVSDAESFRILGQIYEPLVRLAAGSTDELEPALAASWTGATTDTTYVFTLREGVTFQDGTPLDAEAVKANFDRWQNLPDERQANAYYYGTLMDGFGPDNLISGVEATDELTVTVTLREPSPMFLHGITQAPFGIVSPTVLESTDASSPNGEFGGTVVQAGTGPFMLQDYIPDEGAVLVRNEEYWGDPALLDRLIVRPIPDASDRLEALRGGSIDGYDLVDPADYETVESDGFSLVDRPSFSTLYLGINPVARANAAGADSGAAGEYEGDASPVADLAVREAIAAAIDRADLLDAFFGGHGSTADIFMPPSSAWHDSILSGVTPAAYDPDAARALLEEAGFTADNAPIVHFWFPTGVSRPFMPDPEALHAAVTQMLEDVGFTVVAHTEAWGDPGYLFDAENGYYELFLLGWPGVFDDPSNWYGTHFAYRQGEPAAQFDCAVDGLSEAIDAADAAADVAARGDAWATVAGLVHSNVCFVPLVHADTALALGPDVRGYEPSPMGTESLATVWLAGE